MTIAKAANGRPKPLDGQPRERRRTTLTQAVDLQHIMHRAARQLAIDFGDTTTVAERTALLPCLAQSIAAWSRATDARRESSDKPRVGQLSPAERAAIRQRKADGQRRGPQVVTRRKESLSATGPSVRSGGGGGAAGGESVLPPPSLSGQGGEEAEKGQSGQRE